MLLLYHFLFSQRHVPEILPTLADLLRPFYFEMRLTRYRTDDVIALRATSGERKNSVYTWYYVGMETGLAERMSGVGWSGSARLGAPRHPEEVDEPFRDTFLGLLLPN